MTRYTSGAGYRWEDKLSISLRLQWILMILIIAGGIFLIVINTPYGTTEQYTAVENFTEKVPYDVTENYTEKETYKEPLYHGYLINEDPNVGITYALINVTSFSFNNTGKNFRGQNEYMYTVCYQIYCYNYSNITDSDIKTDYVTNYKDIQKSRNVTNYKDIQKSRQINKTININLSLLQRVLHNKSLK
jgi:hypothetical protein